jgi:hypothetical protein
MLFAGCSKDHSASPFKNNLFKVSITKPFATEPNGTWAQVLGGEAAIQFNAIASDSLTATAINDSINLNNIAAYKKQLIAGNYNISLQTKSIAVADTFIRFSAQANAVLINKDMPISLTGTSSDGVITISKKQVINSKRPTFTPAGTNNAYQFGLANGYYFIYVKNAITGRVIFTEPSTGDSYLKDISVSAMNQYDISAILHTTSISVRSNHF